jgi:hypothetical protein
MQLWIHCAVPKDFFVPFDTVEDAYIFARCFLKNSSDDEPPMIVPFNKTLYEKESIVDVGFLPHIQISLIKPSYQPVEGWAYWNADKTFEFDADIASILAHKEES